MIMMIADVGRTMFADNEENDAANINDDRIMKKTYNTMQYKNKYYYSGINPVEFPVMNSDEAN